jgi:hypothetical protein
LDQAAFALVGATKVRPSSAADCFPGRSGHIEDAATRLRRLDEQLAAIVPNWSMAPVVEAYQAMRGVSFAVSVTFVAEIGDLRRFDNPRQLMAFLGLVPSERSNRPASGFGGPVSHWLAINVPGGC